MTFFDMNVLKTAQNSLVFGLGLLFVITSITLLIINKRQRESVLHRLHFKHRRTSGANTPPRSFSPGIEKSNILSEPDTPPSSSTIELINFFPPSRRSCLPEIAEYVPAIDAEILNAPEPSVDDLRDNSLPTTQSYSVENEVPKYTPTGFTTAEIQAMGDFPPYDILSGVPLPSSYEGFQYAKALPRPYRPFRWTYHQTMCKIHVSSRQILSSIQY